MNFFGYKINAQIITKDLLCKIPDEIVHFHNNNYTHFSLKNSLGIEDVKNEFSHYESINNLIKNKSILSEMTSEIITLVEEFKIDSFIILYTEDPGSSYPLSELIILVIKENKIVAESLLMNIDEEGEYLADLYLNYDCLVWFEIPFN
jgi:hypothetical protein